MRLSFVTYTYNDHDFADALLRQAAAMAAGLGAIELEALLVDDGSKVAYSPPPDLNLPVRLVRQQANKGPARAKALGLEAASGDVVFSVDADVRPHPRWLADSLPLLARPDTGLVGATIRNARGRGSFARALYRSTEKERALAEASFVAGGCMLFRRDAWVACGGLAGLEEEAKAFEDVLLCNNMRAAGLHIFRNDRLPVYEARSLHRAAWCRRMARYLAPSAAAVIARRGPEEHIEHLGPRLAWALEDYRRTGDPASAYLLLLEAVMVYRHIALTERPLPEPLPLVCEALAAFPQSLALLREDLDRAGIDLGAPVEPLPAIAPLLAGMAGAGVFSAMEQEWVRRWRAEDAALPFDEHYMGDNARPDRAPSGAPDGAGGGQG